MPPGGGSAAKNFVGHAVQRRDIQLACGRSDAEDIKQASDFRPRGRGNACTCARSPPFPALCGVGPAASRKRLLFQTCRVVDESQTFYSLAREGRHGRARPLSLTIGRAGTVAAGGARCGRGVAAVMHAH